MKTALAISIASRAKGMPAYRVMCPNTSMTWSFVNPIFSAPRMWPRSGPWRPRGGQAGHGTDAAAGNVQARASPGRAPSSILPSSGPVPPRPGLAAPDLRRGAGAHVDAPVLVAPLKQAFRVFVAVMNAGRREVNPPLLKDLLAQRQGLDASRRSAVPGVVDNQFHHLFGRQPDVQRVAQVALQLHFPVGDYEARQGDHLALHRRQGGPSPDSAKQGLAKNSLQVGRDFPGPWRRPAGNLPAAKHPARFAASFVAVIQFTHSSSPSLVLSLLPRA